MLSFEEFKNRRREQETQQSKRSEEQSTPWHDFAQNSSAKGYKAWRDWKGNVNLSNLSTGESERTYQAYNHIGGADSNRSPARDNLLADIGQSVGGALQRQGASYKGAGANLLLSMADLFNGKDEYQPKVGSALWRMQQGAKADMGVANKLMEESKYGHGKAYGLVMDLTSGAVDLASDALLTAATGGASVGGKLGITAGLGAMGARSFGGGAMEAEEKGLDRRQQFLYGLKSASIEMLTEKIGGPFEKIYGGTALGRLTNGLADRLGQSAGMKFVLNRLGDFSGEAVEEMLSDVLNPLADKLMKLDNGEGWEQLWTKEGMSQMAYDGLVGGLLGLFGGAAEGISGKAKAALIGDSIDNAMAASQQGRSIGAELENDKDGLIAKAVSNTAAQESRNAQQQPPQQTTPKTPEVSENSPSREFNSKLEGENDVPFTMGEEEAPDDDRFGATESREALEEVSKWGNDKSAPEEDLSPKPDDDAEPREALEETSKWKSEPKPVEDATDALKEGEDFLPEKTASEKTETPKTGADLLAEQAQPKPKPIGKKTAEKMAGAAFLADMAKQRAVNEARSEQNGVEVDTSDFADNTELREAPKTQPAEEASTETAKSDTIASESAKASADTNKDSAPQKDLTPADREKLIDIAKRKTLKKLGRLFVNAEGEDIRNSVADSGKKSSESGKVRYKLPDARNIVGDRNVPAKERLEAVKNLEKAQFLDEVDDYVDWWMNHKEIVDGQNMSDEERIRLLEAKLKSFVERYDADHNYTWEIADNRNDLVKVYSNEVSSDVKTEEFNMRFSDEQLAENAKQTRLKHALSFDLSTAQIASIIKPRIKPKQLTQHFNVGSTEVAASPYSMNVSYPQTVDKKTGKKGPSKSGQYTVELYYTDAKTDTAVRVLKFKAKTETDVANKTANIIRDFELGGQAGKEALIKKTRAQIAKELNKQLDERMKAESNPLLDGKVKQYAGVYTVDDFKVSIKKNIKEDRGRKLLDGYEVKLYLNDAVTDLVNTNDPDIDPIQIAATLIHDANFTFGKYYDFSWFKHKSAPKGEAAWTVTAKNGKSQVTAPDGSVHETPVGATAADDIASVMGEKLDPDAEEPWFKGLTDADIIYSQKHPQTVTVNGTDYEVRMDWTKGSKNAVEYVITVAGEEDVEAKVGLGDSRADWEVEDFVDFAIKHPKIWETSYVAEEAELNKPMSAKEFRQERLRQERSKNAEEQSGDTSGAEQAGQKEGAEGAAFPDTGRVFLASGTAGGQNSHGTVRDGGNLGGLKPAANIPQSVTDTAKHFGGNSFVVDHSSLNDEQKKASDHLKKLTGKDVFYVSHDGGSHRGGMCDGNGNIYISAVNRTSFASGVATGIHETLHQRLIVKYKTKDRINAAGARIADAAFSKLTAMERFDLYIAYANKYFVNFYGNKPSTKSEVSRAYSTDQKFQNYVKHEALAAYVGGSTILYGKSKQHIDVLQSMARKAVVKEKLFKQSDFTDSPSASEVYQLWRDAVDNGLNYYDEGDETGVDEEFAKKALPEDLDGLSEHIKSSESEFYGPRKERVAKAAEAIAKNIGKDASAVLPESLSEFVGEKFSQASKDIDSFSRDLLTAMATEDDGVALKAFADGLSKRIGKSDGLKALLGDPEKGNVAKMARKLADAEDAKAAQNAASDLAEMVAKEAEELPKTLKKLEKWQKNLGKQSKFAKFLASDKTTAKLASTYFGYQRDVVNLLQGLDNFDKFGDGDGYRMAKDILENNFKAQTAKGNAIDLVLTAQKAFEKSGGANKKVSIDMLKKNQTEHHEITLAEAVDFLHTIRTLEASKVSAWKDIRYKIGDQSLTISSVENFNRVMDALTKAVRTDPAANAYYKSFTEGYALFKDISKEAIQNASGRTVDMFEDGSYYPLLFAKQGKGASSHDFDFGLDTTGYTQHRVNELGGVISITDPATRFNSYANNAANLVTRASVGAEMERLNREGLGTTITDLVEERYGKGHTDAVKQFIKDSSNFRSEADEASSLLRTLRLNIQGGALFGNFGSMLKQFPSVYNAAGILDFDSITHGVVAQLNSKNRKRAAEVGSIKTRHQGNLDPSVAETLNENSGFKKAMEKLKVLKLAREGFEIVDSAAIRSIYLASEYQAEVKDGISRDSADFNDKVMAYFIPAFLQTQPQFEKTLRPYVQTSENELIRMFGMFKTQPLRNLNTMIRTVSEYNSAKENYGADSKEFKAAEKTLRTTLAGQASASLMFGALGVLAKLIYHRRKDLEDKDGKLDPSKVMSRVLMNAAEAAGGSLVFGDAAVQLAIDMASGGKTNEFYGLSAGAVSSVADALDAITAFTEKPTLYNAKKAAGYIATLFGMPLNNAYAVLNSAIMYTKDLTGSNEGNYDDILRYLDAEAKAAKKEEEKAAKAEAKAAEKSGADLLVEAAAKNTSQSELNVQEEQKESKPTGYLSKPYNALIEAGMSSQRSNEVLHQMDTDGNDSVKQSEMIAYWKAHPEDEQYVMAMWNSYGYKTTWEAAKKKAG